MRALAFAHSESCSYYQIAEAIVLKETWPTDIASYTAFLASVTQPTGTHERES